MKNLPKYISEDRLREFFSQKGEVTDAKLLRTKYDIRPLLSALYMYLWVYCFNENGLIFSLPRSEMARAGSSASSVIARNKKLKKLSSISTALTWILPELIVRCVYSV